MDIKGISILLLLGSLIFSFEGAKANRLHAIDIKYPQLFPEGFDWDPRNQHFIVGSLTLGTIHKVSDAGVVEDFIKDNDYAGKAAVGGITVDTRRNRFLAVIQGQGGGGQPGLNALASYDLKSGERFFFVELDHVGVEPGETVQANDVAVDPLGNAYVTNSAGNFIWKITLEGLASVFAKSPIFTSQPIIVEDDMAKFCGLNGIVYNKKGALLVSQSNTGKIYKVDLDDGAVKLVHISKPLPWADGITVRRDDVLLVVSCHTTWFVQSPDNWRVATVVDEVPMNSSLFATAIALREDNKAYVLNCHLPDYIKKISREEFSIQEIEFPKEAAGEKVWVIVLIVVGLGYVFFWRFQMGYVIKNMNKKRA